MSNVYSSNPVRLAAIANAQHIVDGIETHWSALLPFGATPADKKLLLDAIAKSIVMNDSIAAREEVRGTLGELRPEIDDLLGDFRASAGLVAKGPRSVDEVALKMLKPDGTFPTSDAALVRYWKDLPAAIQKYSVELGARGFKRDQQAQLLSRMTAFMKLYRSKAKTKSANKKAQAGRENLFHALAELTSYFRRLGRAALRGSSDRTAFDRVPGDEAARKKKVAAEDEKETAKDKKLAAKKAKWKAKEDAANAAGAAAGATATAPMESSIEPADTRN